MISDESLMLDFQGGSRPAFEELFARYREPLSGFFQRRLNSRERAEDLTQETFIAVIKATVRYQPKALFRTYLYSIALNLLSAECRKLMRQMPESSMESPATSDDVLWVREALQKLEPGDREILMLREFERLSYAEIADLLRVPINTARSRLFRSRMTLKCHLEPEREGVRCP